GFLPLAVTLTTETFFEGFKDDSKAKAFLHGHSYTANPVACAAALASMELLFSADCQKRIADICQWTKEAFEDFSALPMVHSTRSLGTVGAFEVKGHQGYFANDFWARVSRAARERGVLLRPLGGTVYTVPPYSTTEKQFHRIC